MLTLFPDIKAYKTLGCVYIARMDNGLKVGYTSRLKARMATLHASCLAVYDCGGVPEAMGKEMDLLGHFGRNYPRAPGFSHETFIVADGRALDVFVSITGR